LHELSTAISKTKQWSKKRRSKSSMLTFPSKASIISEPFGQVLIVSPWNYPIDLALSPLIGALAAGNTVILKPSEYTPNTSSLIKELMASIFSEDYVSVQLGGVDVSKSLMQFRFDYIFFTGSVLVGKEVMKMAAENLIPVTLELGGKCPVILTQNYSIQKAAKSIAWGNFFNAGQSCIAPDYVLVHENNYQEFVKWFKHYSEQFLDTPQQDYARIINKKQFERLSGYLEQGEIIYGGTTSIKELYFSPTLIKPNSLELPVMQDEIFGPVLPVVTYKSNTEILDIINSREKALVVYIFSKNRKDQKFFMEHTSSGNVGINDTMLNYVNKNLPFGGVGHSGMGKYHGKASFDTFSNFKSVHHKLAPDIPFRYPPYKGQYKLMRSFIKLLIKNI
jgi:aldehyde dehydrogenase (NAD+)